MRASLPLLLAGVAGALHVSRPPPRRSPPRAPAASRIAAAIDAHVAADRRADKISAAAPLRVLIAGAGVGGLVLANHLEAWGGTVEYTVLERTSEFKRFGGPIQLASNAMRSFRELDEELYREIEVRARAARALAARAHAARSRRSRAPRGRATAPTASRTASATSGTPSLT